MNQLSIGLSRSVVLHGSLLAMPFWSSGATIVTTVSPVRIDGASGNTLFNLNASLGPLLDTTDDLLVVVEEFDTTAFVVARGFSGAQVATDGGSLSLARLFTEGDSIDSAQFFESGFVSLGWDSSLGFSLGEWGSGGVGYLGLRFEIDGSFHFGFVRLSWFPDGDAVSRSSYAVVDKFGYNSVSGESAFIPEPSAGLLVGLSLALIALRRRRS